MNVPICYKFIEKLVLVRAQLVHAIHRNGFEDGQADEPAIGKPAPAEMRPKCLAKRPEEVSRREV